uniref:Uncharacterized protein n=1 Tax=Salix viminalis TaxID=40686 RepID=A0A6N2M1N5_SALVM
MIVGEVELSKMRREGAVGMESAIKQAASKVKLSDNPVFISQVTPSHKQQSVPSFHDSVLGCWQYPEAELLMEKDALNWSKETLWP